jgi:hypothetical protein
MQGATSSSSRLTGTITRQKTLGVLLLRLQCMLHLCGEKPHTNIGLQFPGRNSQPNISRSVSIPRLQCMLHLCGNDPHKSTHKHQPYANCHAMVSTSGRIPRRCYLDYSACYLFGCEAPSKGIDGGYHRVNKIGGACQSQPMHIPKHFLESGISTNILLLALQCMLCSSTSWPCKKG